MGGPIWSCVFSFGVAWGIFVVFHLNFVELSGLFCLFACLRAYVLDIHRTMRR